VHNLELPQGISRREVALLRLLQRRTTLLISINTSTPLGDRPQVTITHGHYRDWSRSYPPAAPVPGRVGYFGLIRRYKGVDTLLRAFGELSDHPELSLFIGGKASSRQLQAELTQLATSDPRVECTFAFLTDAELVRAATSSELVVLPYRDMHNSGGVLAALSLNRPVLVPENEVNRRLAQEVGPGWVHTYPDRLSGADLLRALDAVRDASRGCPDLSARDWDKAADQHLAAYRRAISLRRTRSGP